MKNRKCVNLDEETTVMLAEISDFYKLEKRDDKPNISATIRHVVKKAWERKCREKEELMELARNIS